MAKAKKRPVVHLEGTAKVKRTKANVRVEAKITDSNYEFGILKDDIRTKRVWLESPPDDDGWMKLLYSADGPTGDPIPVGKLRINHDTEHLEVTFADLSHLKVEEVKKE
jgi:hypothetical protein